MRGYNGIVFERGLLILMNKKYMRVIAGHGNKLYWGFFVLVLTYAFINAFYGIGSAPIVEWDEARHGVNAYEMIENGDYLIHTYLWDADFWNLKPPVSFWLVALAYRVFGYNAFALRFFSALSLPLITASCMLFIKPFFGRQAGLTAGLLFASLGSRLNHMFLHGDPDALFFLWCFFSLLFLYLGFIKNIYYFLPGGVFFALAFLTKATHVVILFIVGVIAFVSLRKEKKFFIKGFLFYSAAALLPVLAWALWRYSRDGFDFLSAMVTTDVVARVTSAVENHGHGLSYYFLVSQTRLGFFMFWGLLLSAAFALVYWRRRNKGKRPISFEDRAYLIIFLSMGLTPYILFSLLPTKLSWYVYPGLIGFIMVAAWLLPHLTQDLLHKRDKSGLSEIMLFASVFCLGIGLFAYPSRERVQTYFDVNTIQPVSSIFYDDAFNGLTDGEERYYFVTTTQGNQTKLLQSWTLQGIYSGFIYQKGSMEDYLAVMDRTGYYLFVRYDTREALETFMSQYPYLELIASNETTACFTAK